MSPGPPESLQDRLAARGAVELAVGVADLLVALDRRLEFVSDAGDGIVAVLRTGDGDVIARMTAPEVVRLVDGLAAR